MERPLTRNLRGPEPLSLREYEQAGGYQAIRKALADLEPKDVQRLVTESGLRGRGGAGFPTGPKWSFVPMNGPGTKYLVANADEMEPGTFKDRLLLEGDPHQLIEGMLLAAYAIQADHGYIFLRWEYTEAAERLKRALAEAYESRYLGKSVLGTEFSFHLYLHASAGRYICGEETALLNALEGKRVIPRTKPPYPQVSGLWGKPTIVQNVETLCNLPHIVLRGSAWYRSISLSPDGGTKIYGVSGRVRRPGAWELPMGTPLRELLDDHAGGAIEGHRIRAVLPGGASTAFLTDFDVPMDFGSVQKAGSRLGTGTVVVLDDRTCPVGAVLNLERFFAQESCGWCTPCREGLRRVALTLEAIESGRGEERDLEVLERSAKMMGPGLTFCALAPGAADPLSSALRIFREDFEAHIRNRHCGYRST